MALAEHLIDTEVPISMLALLASGEDLFPDLQTAPSPCVLLCERDKEALWDFDKKATDLKGTLIKNWLNHLLIPLC